MSVIKFYDFPSTLPGRSWSYITWKIRYVLNHKGIPYETEWLNYPEVEGKAKALGVKPTGTKADGTSKYTLPMIFDPFTGVTLAESESIAAYLDATYPDTPRVLFPDPPMGSYTTFGDTISAQTAEMILMLVFPHVLPHMLPPSRAYSLKTLAAGGSGAVDQAETTMGGVAKWIGDDSTFVSGEKPSFADFAIAASIRPIRLLWGAESKEWQAVTSWQGGKWGKLMKALEGYETVQ
ncbi:hypothetical protein BDZ89DRAFT_1099211 [Hymenopellis radicata]|nr:hypothetical protein BDZ89DRAFT_1099211 [Hymenopellis radicata]